MLTFRTILLLSCVAYLASALPSLDNGSRSSSNTTTSSLSRRVDDLEAYKACAASIKLDMPDHILVDANSRDPFVVRISVDPSACYYVEYDATLSPPDSGVWEGQPTYFSDLSFAYYPFQDVKGDYLASQSVLEIVFRVDPFGAQVKSQVFTIYLEEKVTPDDEACVNSVDVPSLNWKPTGTTIDIDSTSKDLFSFRVMYDRSGLCAADRYVRWQLENDRGRVYPCSSVYLDPAGPEQGQLMTCNVVEGTMSTLVGWVLTEARSLASRDVRLTPMINARFYVTHLDDPQATGILRRREKEVKAGLRVPSSVQCHRRGYEICPVPGRLGSWECIDTTTKLDACGGCPQAGGRACTELPGISQVSCESGRCKVLECDSSHKLDAGRSACLPVARDKRFLASKLERQ